MTQTATAKRREPTGGDADEVSDHSSASSTKSEDEGRQLGFTTMPRAGCRRISPLDINFSQTKCRHLFGDGRRVAAAVTQILAVRCTEEEAIEHGAPWRLETPFPEIEVIRWRAKLRDEATGRPKVDPATGEEVYDSRAHWFTLDNRRLYCIQEAALKVWPERCVANVAEVKLGPNSQYHELRKFRTLDRGRSIMIGSSSDGVPFVRWSWREKVGVEEGSDSSGPDAEARYSKADGKTHWNAEVLDYIDALKEDDHERIETSKKVSYILRRGYKSLDLECDSDGWVKVKDLLTVDLLPPTLTVAKLIQVVDESNKQKPRYELKDSPQGKLIRASTKRGTDHATTRRENRTARDMRVVADRPADPPGLEQWQKTSESGKPKAKTKGKGSEKGSAAEVERKGGAKGTAKGSRNQGTPAAEALPPGIVRPKPAPAPPPEPLRKPREPGKLPEREPKDAEEKKGTTAVCPLEPGATLKATMAVAANRKAKQPSVATAAAPKAKSMAFGPPAGDVAAQQERLRQLHGARYVQSMQQMQQMQALYSHYQLQMQMQLTAIGQMRALRQVEAMHRMQEHQKSMQNMQDLMEEYEEAAEEDEYDDETEDPMVDFEAKIAEALGAAKQRNAQVLNPEAAEWQPEEAAEAWPAAEWQTTEEAAEWQNEEAEWQAEDIQETAFTAQAAAHSTAPPSIEERLAEVMEAARARQGLTPTSTSQARAAPKSSNQANQPQVIEAKIAEAVEAGRVRSSGNGAPAMRHGASLMSRQDVKQDKPPVGHDDMQVKIAEALEAAKARKAA